MDIKKYINPYTKCTLQMTYIARTFVNWGTAECYKQYKYSGNTMIRNNPMETLYKTKYVSLLFIKSNDLILKNITVGNFNDPVEIACIEVQILMSNLLTYIYLNFLWGFVPNYVLFSDFHSSRLRQMTLRYWAAHPTQVILCHMSYNLAYFYTDTLQTM